MYEEEFELKFLLTLEHHISEAQSAKEHAAARFEEFPHKAKRQRAHNEATKEFEEITKNAIITVKNLSMARLIDESFPILYRLKNSPLWDQVKLS